MKAAKLKRGRLVRIDWVDSAGATEHWEWREDFNLRTYLMHSVGYVWKNSKRNIAIAPHASCDMKQGCGIMVIPWCSVQKVKRLG